MLWGLEKVICGRVLCLALLLLGCTQLERDNPYDPNGVSYNSDFFSGGSSSSNNGVSGNICRTSSGGCVFMDEEDLRHNYCSIMYGGTLVASCGEGGGSSSSSSLFFTGVSSSSNIASSSSFFIVVSSSSDIVSNLCKFSDGTCGENIEPIFCLALEGTPVQSCAENSSSSVSGVAYGTTVAFGGESYPIVTIGTQAWLAKNLNYNVEGSRCYGNDPANCMKYGRLYNWSTAKAICLEIPGWHLPDNADWDKLLHYVDGTSGTSSPYSSSTAGRYLKATSDWNYGGNGEDQHGFLALPGGSYGSNGWDDTMGNEGDWWSASENSSNEAYSRVMSNDSYRVSFYPDPKSNLYSVRCVHD